MSWTRDGARDLQSYWQLNRGRLGYVDEYSALALGSVLVEQALDHSGTKKDVDFSCKSLRAARSN